MKHTPGSFQLHIKLRLHPLPDSPELSFLHCEDTHTPRDEREYSGGETGILTPRPAADYNQ